MKKENNQKVSEDETIFSFELVKTGDNGIIAKVLGWSNLLGVLKRFWRIIAFLAIIIFVITGQITIEQLEKILNLMKTFN